jgi:phage repressor protein C with HTH and peptisase S24 domain
LTETRRTRATSQDYQEFRDILDQLKVLFGLSQKDAAKKLRVSEEMISRYVNERCNLPQTKLNQARILLEEFRNQSPFVENPKTDSTGTGRDAPISNRRGDPRKDSPLFRKEAVKLVHLLQEHGLPLISYARAGQDGFFEDFYPFGGTDEYVKPLCAVKDPLHSFCLEVKGDSMVPRYTDGEIVVICTTSPCLPKDYVLIKTESGEVMIKQYFVKGENIVAHSLNPEFEDRFFDPREVTHIFKIIGSQSRG